MCLESILIAAGGPPDLEGHKARPLLYAQCLHPRGRKGVAGQRREFSSLGSPMVLEVHMEFVNTPGGEFFFFGKCAILSFQQRSIYTGEGQ